MRSIAAERSVVRPRVLTVLLAPERRDLVGLALAIALAGWIFLAARDEGVPAGSAIALLAGSAATYAVASTVARRWAWLVPVAMIGVAVGVFAPDLREVLSGAALAEPLGYANANAALLFQAAMAALLLAAGFRPWWARLPAIAMALAILGVAAFSGSEAAVVLLLGLVPFAIVAPWVGAGRSIAALMAAVLVTMVVVTGVAGVRYVPGGEASPRYAIATVFSERRVALWGEALAIANDHPFAGVGPGMFRYYSPTALSDIDAAWAHSEFLQLAAEAGYPGLMLGLGLFLWAIWRLAARDVASATRGVGLVAVTALGLHASIDYVLHFPAVALAGAAVLGAAVGVRAPSAEP